jgi:hypothetical protein
MSDVDVDHKKALLEILKKRLQEREIQEAKFGPNVDPVIKIEIEDLQDRIQTIEKEIQGLESKSILEERSEAKPLMHAAQEILDRLEITYIAFVAQCRVRNKLVEMLYSRLKIAVVYEYEELFSRYYDQMTDEERHFHNSIRSYTEHTLYVYNDQILKTIESVPELEKQIPSLKQLKKHLILWISKYNGLFQTTPHMCLVYVGVEERVPFPKNVQHEIRGFLREQKS